MYLVSNNMTATFVHDIVVPGYGSIDKTRHYIERGQDPAFHK